MAFSHFKLWFNCLVCFVCTVCFIFGAFSLEHVDCSTRTPSDVCEPGLDQSDYAKRLIEEVHCPTDLSLPSRLVGSVLLSDGSVNGMQCVRLQPGPIRQICANDTLAALQLKVKIPNASIEYAWSFGENCEGFAQVDPQTLYLDFNLEQSSFDRSARLLSSFTTALLDTRFNVKIDRCDIPGNQTNILQQVALICKKVAIRDVDTSIQQLFRIRLVRFVRENPFSLSSLCSKSKSKLTLKMNKNFN